MKAQVTVDTKKRTVKPIIREYVKIGTDVMTDEYLSYGGLDKHYNHQTIKHG